MFDDLKRIFVAYEVRKQSDFNGKDEERLSISGTYELHRDLDGKVYNQAFKLGIVLTEPIPHVYLLDGIDEIKKSGFHHFYERGRCCLGTDVAVLLSWEEGSYNAFSFFDRIVDPFLINTVSYRENKVAAMGELKHGEAGMEEYYCSLFGISKEEIVPTIKKVLSILVSKKISANQKCVCRKRDFGDCDCKGKNFLIKAIKNPSLAKGFDNDLRKTSWAKGVKFRRR